MKHKQPFKASSYLLKEVIMLLLQVISEIIPGLTWICKMPVRQRHLSLSHRNVPKNATVSTLYSLISLNLIKVSK